MSVLSVTTSDGVDLNEIYYDMIVETINKYNSEDKTDFRNLLCADSDETVKTYYIPEVNRFQLIEDDYESPDWSKVQKGRMQNFAEKHGGGFRYAEAYFKDVSSKDIAQNMADLLERDRLTQRYQITRSLLWSGNSANSLWNGAYATYEGISAPPAYGANTFAAGHNHYAGTNYAAGTIHTDDIINAKKQINEHGGNGNFVGFINSTDAAELMKLATFVAAAGGVTKVANPITDKVMVDGYIGRILGVDMIETEVVPANYLLVAKVSDLELGKVCSFVEPNNQSFRGLKLVPGKVRVDYPLIGASAERWFKVAVKNRGAAAAYQIRSGSAVYAVPSAYSAAY